MSAALINEKVTAAVDAIEAGDFSTAKTKLLAAKALLIGRPDTRHLSTELRWNREAIDSLIRQCDQQLSATSAGGLGGVQRTRINYVGARAPEDC